MWIKAMRLACPRRRAAVWSFAVAPVIVILVAWSLAYVRIPLTYIPFPLTLLPNPTASEFRDSPEKGIFRARSYGRQALGVYSVFSGVKHGQPGYRGDLIPGAFPTWADEPFSRVSDADHSGAIEWGVGLPWTCMTYRERFVGNTITQLNSTYQLEWGFPLQKPTPGVVGSQLFPPALPLKPVWSGWILNISTIGVLLLLLQWTIQTWLVRRRLLMGVCPHCSYPLLRSPAWDRCPECGGPCQN